MDPSFLNNQSIRIIGMSGKEGKGENQFAQPRGICMDFKTKEVFIVDCNNHRIQVYHLNSLAYIRQIGKGIQGNSVGTLNYAVGICMDDINQLYVADTNNHRIAIFNRVTGVHSHSIGSHGTANGLFNSPYGVCIDIYTNLLYVADYDNNRIQVFDKESGEFIKVIGYGFGNGPGQLNQPIVVCIDYDKGHILVADYSNNRIVIFDRDTGHFIKNIGEDQGPNKLHGPRGICLSKESNVIIISDRENHRVQLYHKETHMFIRNIGDGMGINPGQFHRPMELCINAEEGVLLVVDGYNHRIQVIEIPELQNEKLRLKALAQSKADSILLGKSIPKPSLLAISTKLSIDNIITFDMYSKKLFLTFPNMLDKIFNISITCLEAKALLNFFKGTVQSTSCSFTTTTLTSYTMVNNKSSQPLSKVNLIIENSIEYLQVNRQSEVFLGILDELMNDGINSCKYIDQYKDLFEESLYMLSTPSLFALQSLLNRGWNPRIVSYQVIHLLFSFLSNIDKVMVNREERVQVLNAITALILASLAVNIETQSTILSNTLKKMNSITKYSSTIVNYLNNHQSDSNIIIDSFIESNDTTNIMVLASYFEILGKIISLEEKKTIPSIPISKQILSPEQIKTNAILQKDILDFVYGLNFMKSFHECMNEYSTNMKTDVIMTVSNKFDNIIKQVQINPASVSKDPENKTQSPGERDREKNVTLPIGLNDLLVITFNIRDLKKAHQNSINIKDTDDLMRKMAPHEESTHSLCAEFDVKLCNLRNKLFNNAAEYFHIIRSQENNNIIRNPRNNNSGLNSLIHRSRGGRNIWHPDESLCVGDLVDCMDKEKSWFESIIQEIMSDGSIKVHFMGWGSKWDDIVSTTEITLRIAPLNTKTKNWRSDLFEGGLIEIKCNDDLINQKWMWGKITKLNMEEAWVEVSFSFSNEPIVVKRAWLYGETICPVGMHTKDKSKAAAALLVKPLKKIEDIIREKGLENNELSETLFTDIEDELEDIVIEENNNMFLDNTTITTNNTINHNNHSNNSYCYSINELIQVLITSSASSNTNNKHQLGHSSDYSLAIVGLTLMQCIMDELVYSICDEIDKHIDDNDIQQDNEYMKDSSKLLLNPNEINTPKEQYSQSIRSERRTCLPAAINLISFIASTSFKRLLIPFFIRILVFKAGMKVKIISSGYLTNKFNEYALHSMKDFDLILQLIDRFQYIGDYYSTFIIKCLGGSLLLTPQAMNQLKSRVLATVNRCGVSYIAHDFIDLLSKEQISLSHSIFNSFIGINRYSNDRSKLRKLLSSLLKSISRSKAIQFKTCFEEFLIHTLTKRFQSHMIPITDRSGIITISWAMKLIISLHIFYEDMLSLSTCELVNITDCNLSVLHAIQKYFNELPIHSISYFAQALAMTINVIQDTDFTVFHCDDVEIKEYLSPFNREKILIFIFKLMKVIVRSDLLDCFKDVYENLLSFRLLHSSYSNIASEKYILEHLPIIMPNAMKMMEDISQTTYNMGEFSKYMMNKVDNDEILYDSPVIDLLLEKRCISIHILCSNTWKYVRKQAIVFQEMKLPLLLLTIQNYFTQYYHTRNTAILNNNSSNSSSNNNNNNSSTNTHNTSRKLLCCNGLGTMVLACVLNNSYRNIIVNEVQASILFLFTTTNLTIKNNKQMSVLDICNAINVTINEVRGVIDSLANNCSDVFIPLLELKDHASNGLVTDALNITWNTKVSLSISLLTNQLTITDEDVLEPLDYSKVCMNKIPIQDRNMLKDWYNEKLDACIMKVLKLRYQSYKVEEINTRHFQYQHVLFTFELVEHVLQYSLSMHSCGNNNTNNHNKNQNNYISYSSEDIIMRADHLVSLGFIEKTQLQVSPDSNIRSSAYLYVLDDDQISTEKLSNNLAIKSITTIGYVENNLLTTNTIGEVNAPVLPSKLYLKLSNLLFKYKKNYMLYNKNTSDINVIKETDISRLEINNNSISDNKLLDSDYEEEGDGEGKGDVDDSNNKSNRYNHNKNNKNNNNATSVGIPNAPDDDQAIDHPLITLKYFMNGLLTWIISNEPNNAILTNPNENQYQSLIHRKEVHPSDIIAMDSNLTSLVTETLIPNTTATVSPVQSTLYDDKFKDTAAFMEKYPYKISAAYRENITTSTDDDKYRLPTKLRSFPSLALLSSSPKTEINIITVALNRNICSISYCALHTMINLVYQLNLLLHEYSISYYDTTDMDHIATVTNISPPSIYLYQQEVKKYSESYQQNSLEMMKDSSELHMKLFLALPNGFNTYICDQFIELIKAFSNSTSILPEFIQNYVNNIQYTQDCIQIWSENWSHKFILSHDKLIEVNHHRNIISMDEKQNKIEDFIKYEKLSSITIDLVLHYHINNNSNNNQNEHNISKEISISLYDFISTAIYYHHPLHTHKQDMFFNEETNQRNPFDINTTTTTTTNNNNNSTTTNRNKHSFGLNIPTYPSNITTKNDRKKSKQRSKTNLNDIKHTSKLSGIDLKTISEQFLLHNNNNNLKNDSKYMEQSISSSLFHDSISKVDSSDHNITNNPDHAPERSIFSIQEHKIQGLSPKIIPLQGSPLGNINKLSPILSTPEYINEKNRSIFNSSPNKNNNNMEDMSYSLRDKLIHYNSFFHNSLWKIFSNDYNRIKLSYLNPSTPLVDINILHPFDISYEVIDKIAFELLQSLSKRIFIPSKENTILESSSSTTCNTNNASTTTLQQSTLLWFLTKDNNDYDINNILKEAFSFLNHHNNTNGYLLIQDFKCNTSLHSNDIHILKHYNVCKKKIPIVSLKDILVERRMDPISSMYKLEAHVNYDVDNYRDKNKVFHYTMYQIVQQVCHVLEMKTSWYDVVVMLVSYRWNANKLIEEYLSNPQLVRTSCQIELHTQHFLCLATSKVDLFSFIKETVDDISTISILCMNCKCHCSIFDMYSLNCRHFACSKCWVTHINKAIESDEFSIPCILNTSIDNTSNNYNNNSNNNINNITTKSTNTNTKHQCHCSLHVNITFLAFLTNHYVCESTTVQINKYFNNLLRVYEKDFEYCQKYSSCFFMDTLYSLATDMTPEDFNIDNLELYHNENETNLINKQDFIPFKDHKFSTPNKISCEDSEKILSGVQASYQSPRNNNLTVEDTIMKNILNQIQNKNQLFSTYTDNDQYHNNVFINNDLDFKITTYISETRLLMQNKLNEVHSQIKFSTKELDFFYLMNKLSLLNEYLKALNILEYINAYVNQIVIYDAKYLIESLREILIVIHSNMKNKWNNSLILTDKITNDSIFQMKQLIQKIFYSIYPKSIYIHRMNRLSHVKHISNKKIRSQCDQMYHYLIQNLSNYSIEYPFIHGIFSEIDSPHWDPYEMNIHSTESLIDMDEYISINYEDIMNELSEYETLKLRTLIKYLRVLSSEFGINIIKKKLSITSDTIGYKNIVPLLVSIIEKYIEQNGIVCELVLKILIKISYSDIIISKSLIDLSIWSTLSFILQHYILELDICILCCKLMTCILMSSEENKRYSIALFETNHVYKALKTLFGVHELDYTINQVVIQVFVNILEKNYTSDSLFNTLGICELIIKRILFFIDYELMKVLLIIMIGKLSMSNKYMQDKLMNLDVSIPLISIIYHSINNNENLLKSGCWAVISLVHKNNNAQSKFISMGGCKIIVYALQVINDLNTIMYIIRTIASLALHNSFVQDCFQLENTIELLQTKYMTWQNKKSHIESKLRENYNLLYLTYQYAIDAISGEISKTNNKDDLFNMEQFDFDETLH